MKLAVVRSGTGHRLEGDGLLVEVANRFLAHLEVRCFAPATIRGYAYDLLNFGRFLAEKNFSPADVVPTDLFDYLGWQCRPRTTKTKVVRLSERRGPAPATMNRRIAAVRGMFEYTVICGVREDNPVPAARRSTGLRPKARGMLGHIGPRHTPTGGRLVRQPRRLPDSLEPDEVAVFLADLCTARDRAMALAMLVGGLRAAEVRSLLLADVDRGMRRVKVVGKGNKERTVPVDAVFFVELGNYLRSERPPGCSTPECFVVLRGPTRGAAMTEAGMPTPAEKKRFLVDQYRNRLTQWGFPLHLTFELVDEKGHELLLVFGTGSSRGIEKMKDAMWRIDPVTGSRFRDPRDPNQMQLDLSEGDPNLSLLSQQILSELESGPKSMKELQNFTLLETVYKKVHAKKAVDALEAGRKVECDHAKAFSDFIMSVAPPSLFG